MRYLVKFDDFSSFILHLLADFDDQTKEQKYETDIFQFLRWNVSSSNASGWNPLSV